MKALSEALHTNILLVGFDHEINVRTLVRSFEESNGAEARRLIHSRYVLVTQNLQYAFDAEDHDACKTLV